MVTGTAQNPLGSAPPSALWYNLTQFTASSHTEIYLLILEMLNIFKKLIMLYKFYALLYFSLKK